jgi:hypothetical protein
MDMLDTQVSLWNFSIWNSTVQLLGCGWLVNLFFYLVEFEMKSHIILFDRFKINLENIS